MAAPELSLPYGLRDVKLRPIDAAGVVGASVDLPAGRTLSFSEAEDFEELRGDDRVIAIRGKGPKVEWELESGGISLAAYRIMAGGTLTLTGVAPNEKKSFKKLDTDARPYFQVEGQAISDSGGDFHAVLFRARASDTLEGELSDGQFWLTAASGEAIGNAAGELYEFVQNETAVAIV
jgi:hypothetical protein